MEYKVNRKGDVSNALTRTQNELQEALGKIPIDTTSSYYTSITASNFTQSNHESLSEDRTADLDAGQALSPFTINNKLIDEVIPSGSIKSYASSKNIIPPEVTYAASLLSNPNAESVTLQYNKLIEPISDNSRLDIEGYNSAFGFSVYEPIIEGNTWPTNTPLQRANGSSTWTQKRIIDVPKEDINTGITSDFRRPLVERSAYSTIMSLSPDYNTQNIERRVSLGNPGRKGRNVINYTIGNGALDKITAGGFYSGSSPNHSRDNDRNDLVKFSIGLLQNNGSGVSNYMHFRAFINEFSDGYNAEWGETRYIGRGDKFYNYKGFDRKISMGWTVYAQSKEELIPMYKKLNYLASSLAPDYSSGGYMRGNLARLTVGGYLYNQLGIIKSITYTIPNESTWEIGISNEPRPDGNLFDSSVKELAHMINVTGFEFIPIEKSVPEKGKTRFIHLSTGEGSANTNWGDGNVDMPVDPSPSVPPQPLATTAPPPKEKDPAIDTSVGTATLEGFTRNEQVRDTTLSDTTPTNAPGGMIINRNLPINP